MYSSTEWDGEFSPDGVRPIKVGANLLEILNKRISEDQNQRFTSVKTMIIKVSSK